MAKGSMDIGLQMAAFFKPHRSKKADAVLPSLPSSVNELDRLREREAEIEYQQSILKFSSMGKLISHLECHLQSDVPFLNSPSARTLKLLLAVATLSHYNTSNIAEIDNESYNRRPINLRALDILNECLGIVKKKLEQRRKIKTSNNYNDDFFNVQELYDEEVTSLEASIDELFKFLVVKKIESPSKAAKPGAKRAVKSKSTSDVDAGPLTKKHKTQSEQQPDFNHLSVKDINTSLHMSDLSPGKREMHFLMKEQSVDVSETIFDNIATGEDIYNTNVLGNTHFEKLNKTPWDFFKWAFKCASLANNQRTYGVSWEIWRGLIQLFISYYKMDFDRITGQLGVDYSLNSYILRKSKLCQAILLLNQNSLKLSCLDVVDVVFADGKSDALPIFENELRVMKKAAFVSDLSEGNEQQDQLLNIDSIEIRKYLLSLLYTLLNKMERDGKHNYRGLVITRISSNLLKCPYKEICSFFDANELSDSEMLLKIASEIFGMVGLMIESNDDHQSIIGVGSCTPSSEIDIFDCDLDFVKAYSRAVPAVGAHEDSSNNLDVSEKMLEYCRYAYLINLVVAFQLRCWINNSWDRLEKSERGAVRNQIMSFLSKGDEAKASNIVRYGNDIHLDSKESNKYAREITPLASMFNHIIPL
ncbi:hypothetical protein CANARDRAFT_23194 [[Candida] arabinofermentans NRRL YB-2248]|uniref:Uncharacterized protein n=1 Tax=[Candida] arabinofermentans NRRL YB-2248 TaxID=983967 RepID=A0A1E4T079_9ASCO|nr:hypothetical protein CANARDRAFT_23194 [[Candida] arabinofermentans NRRL YB-2248]